MIEPSVEDVLELLGGITWIRGILPKKMRTPLNVSLILSYLDW